MVPVPHYVVQPDPDHKGKFRVVNTAARAPDGKGPKIHASNVTKADAVKQWRLLEAVKHDPGWKPAPGHASNLRHVPGPGKYPGTGYSSREEPVASYGQSVQRTSGGSDPLVPEPVKGRKMSRPDAATMRKLQSQGKAIKNAKGAPSFQIQNGTDLDHAINAIGRVRPNTEEARSRVRRYVIQRAKALGLSSRIPDSWAADGSLKSGGGSSSSS